MFPPEPCREIIVRTFIASAFVVAALAVTSLATSSPSLAQEYPWCAQYGGRGGGTNCGFISYRQCMAALSGNGGICSRNQFFHGPYEGRRLPPPERYGSYYR
jgi:hypothetical protein